MKYFSLFLIAGLFMACTKSNTSADAALHRLTNYVDSADKVVQLFGNKVEEVTESQPGMPDTTYSVVYNYFSAPYNMGDAAAIDSTYYLHVLPAAAAQINSMNAEQKASYLQAVHRFEKMKQP